jgi:hypothetical protein
MTKRKDPKDYLKLGRPPTHESPKTMIPLIQEYIEECIEDDNPPSIAGLCLAIGFSSRDTFCEYRKKPEFSDTLGKVHLWVQDKYATSKDSSRLGMNKFLLMQMGYSERSEQGVNLEANVKNEYSGKINVESESIESIASLLRDKLNDL